LSLEELQELDERWVMPTYKRAPVEFVRGEGALLWDADGKQYLDFFSGLAVANAGHCHPRITSAIVEQAGRLAGVSNLYYTEPGIRLAERLGSSSLGSRVFLCNSGAEANECAIKLARKHAHGRGIAEPEIVVLEGAFHGRTLAALAATPKLAREDLFGPLPAGFVAVARDDPRPLRDAVGERTAAVMIEPIQGESGVWPIANEVVAAAREACDEAGALLVFDEIQCGMGRTGSLWAYEQLPVRPDVLTAAKALGGGLPVGACVTAPEVGDVFEPGDHGSTFAGAPLACAAALAALETIDDRGLLRRVREVGAHLAAALDGLEGVAEVRGRGLMVGVGLTDGLNAGRIASDALEAGLVVNAPVADTLRLLPPLVIANAEVGEALGILEPLLSRTHGDAGDSRGTRQASR
jgi:acetylornithine/N-succinyldiaminopimelate aminotransferase